MAAGDPLIDTLFDGRYLIIRKLGSGGMANVYLAADQELGRRVAIKILDDRHARDEQFVERFRREAQNAAGLSHPSIVSIYDRGDSEGTYYIAMEYVEGRTLKELLVARGPSPLGIAIDYTRQILSALRFAHRNGIVHRDIKPHNVIVDGEGRVKVMDFGIARAGAASQMTEAGSIIGTAQYLSPEQARGAPVDQTSDLYSTGIVLYELLTGSVPFTGETPVEIAMKHLSQAPVAPSAHRPEIPRDLDYVVLRALAKDPADRYHSAEEMDSDLERIARGIGVSAETAEAATTVLSKTDVGEAATTIGPAAVTGATYTPGRYYEYDEPPRKRTIWPWLLALALIAGALVGGWFAYEALQDQLSATKPVAVPDVEGLTEQLAVTNIREAGLKELVQRSENDDGVKKGLVAEQDPQPGERIEKGNFVTIIVSEGPPKTTVPDVVGQSRDDAVSDLVECRPEGQRRADQLARTRQHGAGDRAEGGNGAPRRGDRTSQRLEGAEADHGAERDRVRVRDRPVHAPGRRLRGRARGGRGSRGRRHRGRPEPGRRDAAEQGIRDHAPGVLGAADLADSGRDEPDRGGRPRAAGAVGLRRAGGRGDRR